VLYVYTIQQRYSPREKYAKYFEAAAKCQKQISFMAEEGSLVQRYSVVLEELRLEALKQTQGYQESRNTIPDLNSRVQPNSYVSQPGAQLGHIDGIDSTHASGFEPIDTNFSNPDDVMAGDSQHGATPSSLMAELTGWGEFNSLVRLGYSWLVALANFLLQVTAGIGGLDFLFMGDPNQHWEAGAMDNVGVAIMSPRNDFSNPQI
jgi:hypothetical protein